MIKLLLDNIRSVHFSTELLETLDWDEEKAEEVMVQLSEYFNENAKADIARVRYELPLLFDKSVCDVIFKYMDYIANRLKQEKGQIEYEA